MNRISLTHSKLAFVCASFRYTKETVFMRRPVLSSRAVDWTGNNSTPRLRPSRVVLFAALFLIGVFATSAPAE